MTSPTDAKTPDALRALGSIRPEGPTQMELEACADAWEASLEKMDNELLAEIAARKRHSAI